MIRAIQSANNIVRHLPQDLPRFEDPLLCEGAPIPPEPPVGHWKPELFVRKPYFLKIIISFSNKIIYKLYFNSSFMKMEVELKQHLEDIFIVLHQNNWKTQLK